MTDLFDKAEDYLPAFVYLLLWLLVFPVRWVALAFLPYGSRRVYHPLFKVREFFAFERY